MSFVAVAVGGLAVGAAGTVGKAVAAGKANKKLGQLEGEIPGYGENPIVKQRLELAKTLLNARAPGAAAAQNNIYSAGANAYGNVERTATDSSTALSMGAGILGQTDQAFQDLQQKEAEDYQRRLQDFIAAQEGVVREGDKVFQAKTGNFQDKVAIQGAQTANTANTWQSLSNFGYGAANFGILGGFGGIGKKIGTGSVYGAADGIGGI